MLRSPMDERPSQGWTSMEMPVDVDVSALGLMGALQDLLENRLQPDKPISIEAIDGSSIEAHAPFILGETFIRFRDPVGADVLVPFSAILAVRTPPDPGRI
jgi:hypothetical protein